MGAGGCELAFHGTIYQEEQVAPGPPELVEGHWEGFEALQSSSAGAHKERRVLQHLTPQKLGLVDGLGSLSGLATA